MRHGNTVNKLSRDTQHRKALLSNLANSLIIHKRINTTVAKAKALRKYIEPILTKGKADNTHSRRVVFSYLQNKQAVKELFGDVANKIAQRPGGYTRIIKLGFRKGDVADMALIELVDYNTLYTKDKTARPASARKTRRGKAKTKKEEAVQTAEPAAEVAEKKEGE